MKKLFSLLLSVILALSLAACGANNTEMPSNNTSAPPSLSPEETPPAVGADIGDGTGTYEGETDGNGKFTGYGVWVYHNYRYEGYFVDGVPNGEGTLYETVDRENDPLDISEIIVQGQWIDGYGNGTITYTEVSAGVTNVYTFDVQNGLATTSGEVEGIASGLNVSGEIPCYLPIGEGEERAFVPPWANVWTDPSLPAPKGSGTNIPPQGQSQPSNSSTAVPPSAASTSADISELTFNAQSISLSAQINADDTITYTYKDTSIKPSYTSDEETRYNVIVYGATADWGTLTAIDIVVTSELQNGTQLLDMANLSGSDEVTGGGISVTVNSDGLTMTWTAGNMSAGYDDFEQPSAFKVQVIMHIGGTEQFSEEIDFGPEIVK